MMSFRDSGSSFRRLLAAAWTAVLLSVPCAEAQVGTVKLFDTGPANDLSSPSQVQVAIGAGTGSQYMAAQFVVNRATKLDSINAWFSYIVGGNVNLKIYADSNGLPGTSVYQRTFVVQSREQFRCDPATTFPDPASATLCNAGWVTFGNLNIVDLPAGTYWVALEPEPGMFAGMPLGAPFPMPAYAWYGSDNGLWLPLAEICDFYYPGCTRMVDAATLGLQFFGTGPLPAKPSGTAARAILEGYFLANGFEIFQIEDLQGNFGANIETKPAFGALNFGSSYGKGSLSPFTVSSSGPVTTITGPHVEAYAAAIMGRRTGGTGAARAIAYAEYVNPSPTQVATFRVNTVLRGGFVDAAGHAMAGIHVFDTTAFLNTLDASGMEMREFLLGGDTLRDYAIADPSTFALDRLFPFAELTAPAWQRVGPPPGQVSTTLQTGFVSVLPGASVIVLLDLSVYQPAGGTTGFLGSLDPAPMFLTDAAGNLSTMVATQPWAPQAPLAAQLVLTPSVAENPITTSVTLTATATTASGAPVPDTTVLFKISSGPNAQPLGPGGTDRNGKVSFTYAGGSDAGTDQIQASIGTLVSNSAAVTWSVPGPFDHITMSPASATVTLGTGQPYTTEAFDVFDHSIGDVTAATAFSIAPDGSCAGATCIPGAAGPHTVTASYGGKQVTASLTATAPTSSHFVFQGFFAPVDMSANGRFVWNTVRGGQAVPMKWLLTRDGVPVSDPASFAGLWSYPVACASGSGSAQDAVPEMATGASGLQYNGNGFWQYNWKTASSYKDTCRAVVAKFSDGTASPAAAMKFK